jgi:hypothetical protein
LVSLLQQAVSQQGLGHFSVAVQHSVAQQAAVLTVQQLVSQHPFGHLAVSVQHPGSQHAAVFSMFSIIGCWTHVRLYNLIPNHESFEIFD